MIENGTELIVKGFQIGLGIGFAIGHLLFHHLVLPADDFHRGDIPQAHGSKKGQQLRLNDGGFCLPCAVLQAAAQVLFVDLVELGKAHVQTGVQPQMEILLPLHGVPFQRKAALRQVLCLTGPVLVPALHIPGVVLLVPVNRHDAPPYTVTSP